VSSPLGTRKCRNSHRPSSEGTFRVDAPKRKPIHTVDSG
jgi:hypothetical protein